MGKLSPVISYQSAETRAIEIFSSIYRRTRRSQAGGHLAPPRPASTKPLRA